jgi:thiol-disulfide isomerase/thioredoxin
LTTACSQSSSNITPTDAPAPQIGIEAVELKDLISNSDRPYVVLNFFATWCKPCRAELPDLVALQNDEKSEIKVLLVSIDNAQDAKGKLKGFLGELGVNFQTYSRPVAEGSLIKQFYPVWDGYIPLSLVYNKQGQLLEAITGLTDRSEIELIVNKHKQLGS